MLTTPRWMALGLAAGLVLGSSRAHAQALNLEAIDVAGPDEIAEGGPLSVEATVLSNRTTSFRYSLRLTVGGLLDDAVNLGTFGPVSIGAEGTATIQRTVNLPVGTTGHYRLAVVVDPADAVAEGNEFDNVAIATRSLRIRALAADFAVRDVRTGVVTATDGEGVGLSYRVDNVGERDGTAELAAYLSTDAVITTEDIEIGRESITLAAGTTATGNLPCTMPSGLPTGDYFVGLIADPGLVLNEISESNNGALAAAVLNLRRSTLSLEATSFPNGTLALPYHAYAQAEGGNGRFVYSVASGQLPPGLALDAATGLVSGVPTMTGTFGFELGVMSAGIGARQSFQIDIASTGISLHVVTEDLFDGALGIRYEELLVAAGGEPPYSWDLASASGPLPPGLDLTTGGVLTGVPTAIGVFNFVVEVTDRLGATAILMLDLQVSRLVNVNIVAFDPVTVQVGEPVNIELEANGGRAPYSWQAISTPPPGLTVTEEGEIVGVPTHVGEWPFRVRVEDATHRVGSDTGLIVVRVEGGTDFELLTGSLAPAKVRATYKAILEARGGEPPYRWRVAPGDSLPDGFQLRPAEEGEPEGAAILTGVSYRSLHHAFSVRVEDAAGRRRTVALALNVEGAGSASDGGCVCVSSGRRPGSLAVVASVAMFLLLPLIRRRRT